MKKIIFALLLVITGNKSFAINSESLSALYDSKDFAEFQDVQKIEQVEVRHCRYCYVVEVTGTTAIGKATMLFSFYQTNVGAPIQVYLESKN
jgi:hypothetical protein